MKLLKETILDFKPVILEAEGKPKEYFLEGIFIQANVTNHNRRRYPMENIEPEVNRYIKECVQRNRAWGELGHPDTPNINFERVSHMVKDLRREGDNFYGRAKVLDTPMGKIVKNLLDEDGIIGMSTRGTGSLRATGGGIMEVGPDFRLATAGDLVHSPSAPDAFLRSIMEGTDFFFDEAAQQWLPETQKAVEQLVEQTKKEVKTLSAKQIHEHKAKLFEEFVKSLEHMPMK
jgi:hypothetical protein